MLIGVVLALGVVGFVGYPLVRGVGAEEDFPEMSEELEELYRRKESTYSALKELEFDFKTGKLSEGDFHELDARYRKDALDILKALDAGEQEATPAATRRSGASAKRSKPKPAVPMLQAGECGECGRQNPPGSRFCAACGTTLEDGGKTPAVAAGVDDGTEDPDADVCTECGREFQPGHKFCAGCGAEVGS